MLVGALATLISTVIGMVLGLPAGVMIILLVICIYFVGDALRDAMDPRNTERR